MLKFNYKHTAHFLKIVFFITVFALHNLQGQNANDITFDEATLKIGARVATNGIGFFYRTTQPIKNHKRRLYDIDLSSIKNPKEKEVINPSLANTRPYIFNKINRVYNLRCLGGFQHVLAERNSKNSIGIALFAAAGPTITFIKPIFLDVLEQDPNFPTGFINVSRRYNPETSRPTQIIGNSSYFTGINQTKINLGLSVKSGIEFNWGSFGSDFKSLEVGIMVDCLPANPEILYNQKNKIFYSGFYLSFAYGKNR